MIMSQLPFYFLIFFWLIDYPLITISYSCTNLVDNNQNCQQRNPNNVIRYFVCDIFGIAYGSVFPRAEEPNHIKNTTISILEIDSTWN
jgi:hypothetical protein